MFLVGDVIKYDGKHRTVLSVSASELGLKELSRGSHSTAKINVPSVKSKLLRLEPISTEIETESIGYLEWLHLLPDGRQVRQVWDKTKPNGRAFRWHLDGTHYPIPEFWIRLYNL